MASASADMRVDSLEFDPTVHRSAAPPCAGTALLTCVYHQDRYSVVASFARMRGSQPAFWRMRLPVLSKLNRRRDSGLLVHRFLLLFPFTKDRKTKVLPDQRHAAVRLNGQAVKYRLSSRSGDLLAVEQGTGRFIKASN